MVFPTNKKFLKLVNGNDYLDDLQLSRLKAKKVQELFVKKEDFFNYNTYVGKTIKNRLNNCSEEEKIDTIKQEAKKVIDNIDALTGSEDSNSWTENCVEVSKGLVTVLADSQTGSIYDKLKNLLSDKPSLINHSLLVSSLSVIFGMGLGIYDSKTIGEVSLGGILHDVGMAICPQDTIEKFLTGQEMTKEEAKLFKSHPAEGVKMVQTMKTQNVTDKVKKIIAEHHENATDSGFPHQMPLAKISYLSKIIAVADKLSLEFYTNNNVDIKDFLTQLKVQQEDMESKEIDPKIIAGPLDLVLCLLFLRSYESFWGRAKALRYIG
jgi:putative nucleotidyltransferase with HDIG domain